MRRIHVSGSKTSTLTRAGLSAESEGVPLSVADTLKLTIEPILTDAESLTLIKPGRRKKLCERL